MRMRNLWLAAVGALLCAPLPARLAQGGVVFYVNDPSGFAAATASHVPLGSEDWSSAGNANAAVVTDPLQPGVAKAPFPNGVAAATGMTVQSNSLGNAATALAPGGNLFYAPAGFVGVSGAAQASNQLSSNVNGASFDMIFANVGDATPAAVSFSPMFYRTSGASNSATLSIEVFGTGGSQIGSTTVPGVADISEAAFVGVVTTPPDALGRVNVWATLNDVAGADNIDVLTVPEAGSAGAFAAIAALVGMRRASRRRG